MTFPNVIDPPRRSRRVFFGSLVIDPSLAEEMVAGVRRTIEENTDNVYVLSLCDACGSKITLYGIAKEASDPEFLII